MKSMLAMLVGLSLTGLSGCASSSQSDWSSASTGSILVTTQKSILNGKTDILLVLHNDEGEWQFLAYSEPAIDVVVTVSLDEILKRDTSINDLSDLPRGWRASRLDRSHPWERLHQ